MKLALKLPILLLARIHAATERDEHFILCPRCGMESQWSFLDGAKREVEIMCPDCGRYNILREQFDVIAGERAASIEPENH